MAMFTLPQMISRLTKGFVKFTGRKPDGLEKIKIKQEALERIKQQDKVVDMEGNVIDTSKGIMGGREIKAMGGRIGLKAGMNRRAFLKLMGGVGAGIGALKTGLLKLAGKGAASQAAKEIIKTPAAAGKPEWFDALVTKVINEGTDVTKQFAYKDRLIVNTKQISPTEQVTIYRDLEDGSVRINYGVPFSKNKKGEFVKVMNDPEDIDLIVRPGVADETNPRPTATFEAGEADVRVANMDGDMEFDGERIVDNVNDLRQDVTNLKIYARGDNKPTMKEFVEQRKKQKAFDEFQQDPVKQAEYLEETYGPPREPDAKGGLAGMLGE
jgi:hypothetical protein